MLCPMAETLNLRHERVDDIPLIIGVAHELQIADVLDRHLGTHGLRQGLSHGGLAVGWLAYILSEGDHRKSAVRGWANALPHTLEQLLGQPIREVEFSDDRLGALLHRLSADEAWEAIEHDLWAATVTASDLHWTGIRLDSTTSYGYHQVAEAGLMQFGHSKDHRPDLPQLKLMAAAAEPMGQVVAADIHSGERADDRLYSSLIARVRALLGRSGVLYTGDCKMAALATRAEIVAHHDYYLMPLPLIGETAARFEDWLSAIVDGEQAATLVWDGERLLGGGYEWERMLSATVAGQALRWTERVQVVRSNALAERQQMTLARHLAAATAQLWALTPPPGRGKRQIREPSTLEAAITRVLERHAVAGLLTVRWEREVSPVRFVITAVEHNEAAIRARERRLGWRVQLTNAPVERLSLSAAVTHYRGGWALERDFHQVKDRPLGLSPLFVWKDDQIIGLTRLLLLALRLMTLIETQVRQGLARAGEGLAGLYEGQPTRTTERPSGRRILQAFARAKLTWTEVQLGPGSRWHLTPLSPLHEQLLHHLDLPTSLYTSLAYDSS